MVAMRAEVPVPQGERSRHPVKLPGASQLGHPVPMVTALRRSLATDLGGADSWEMVTPASEGSSGWCTGYCSLAASVSMLPKRTMSLPSSGVSSSPKADASAMA